MLETSKRINRVVVAEEAHFPGEIRTGGVEVSTIQGRYVPPMLTEAEVRDRYQELMDQSISETESVVSVFIYYKISNIL